MSNELPADVIRTRLWEEEAQADNPFAAAASYCCGYDVYRDLLPNAPYVQYLYLLFRGEPPSDQAAVLLERLAIALANPGPRDPAVHAAMAAGVGGSTAASSLMAALAAGAGAGGGAREVYQCMAAWQAAGDDSAARLDRLSHPHVPKRLEVWPATERPPGFAEYGDTCAPPVLQTLTLLADNCPDGALSWLLQYRSALETKAGRPLAMTAVAAAALLDLGFAPHYGEMLFLLLRLPGAAAHALEQQDLGFRQFPFFGLDLEDDPDRAQGEVRP